MKVILETGGFGLWGTGNDGNEGASDTQDPSNPGEENTDGTPAGADTGDGTSTTESTPEGNQETAEEDEADGKQENQDGSSGESTGSATANESSASPEASMEPSPSVSPQQTVNGTLEPMPTEPPSPSQDVPWGWLTAVVVLGVALAAALVALAFRGGRRKAPKRGKVGGTVGITEERVEPASQVPAVPAIGKLHEQGARPGQQDCFSVSPEDMVPTHGLLAIVADGMGGLSDGDKVSQTAVSAMTNAFFSASGSPEEVLLRLIAEGNSAVNRLLGPAGLNKSGSTVVAGLVRDGYFYSVSVGDSHIALLRDGRLYTLNREHAYKYELAVKAVNGECSFAEVFDRVKGAGLTSFLGMGMLKYIDLPVDPVRIRVGDKFLLMSDGVYNALAEEEIETALQGPPEIAAETLHSMIAGKAYTNQDNYTAVILGF